MRVGSGSRSPTLRRIRRGKTLVRPALVFSGPRPLSQARNTSGILPLEGSGRCQGARFQPGTCFSESFGNPGWRLLTTPSAGRSGASLKRKALPESTLRAASEKVPGEAALRFTGGKNWEMRRWRAARSAGIRLCLESEKRRLHLSSAVGVSRKGYGTDERRMPCARSS